jgi:hypothetical protein
MDLGRVALMPWSRVIAYDEQLRIAIGGRKDLGRAPRMPRLPRVQSPSSSAVNAIVKVAYMRTGRTAGYLAYIERDGSAGPAPQDGTTAAQGYSGYMAREGAGEAGQRAELFTREGQVVDREAFVNRSVGDPRVWALIVSPGRNDLDMERYIREFMRQMELDRGKRFDWLAAVHRNTPYTHAHILLRGKDRDGHAFRLPKEYLTQALAQQATAMARLFVERGWLRTVGHRRAQAAGIGWPELAVRWFTWHAREGVTR